MELVETSSKERIGYITLNRPEVRNALNAEMIMALQSSFALMERTEQVKVVILRAKGTVFCAGADLKYLEQLQANSYEDNIADSTILKDLLYKIYLYPKPVIAQVQGHAIAGGCGLMTVCDFVLTVPEAKFGYTEVQIGFLPALVMIFLIRKIGESRARELLLGGNLVDADQAREMHLVNRIVAEPELENKVEVLANELITRNSTTSMAMTKKMISEVQNIPLEEALTYAADMNAKSRSTRDFQRGVAAFLNKEKFSW